MTDIRPQLTADGKVFAGRAWKSPADIARQYFRLRGTARIPAQSFIFRAPPNIIDHSSAEAFDAQRRIRRPGLRQEISADVQAHRATTSAMPFIAQHFNGGCSGLNDCEMSSHYHAG